MDVEFSEESTQSTDELSPSSAQHMKLNLVGLTTAGMEKMGTNEMTMMNLIIMLTLRSANMAAVSVKLPSIDFMSFVKRLMIRPTGVTSRNRVKADHGRLERVVQCTTKTYRQIWSRPAFGECPWTP